MELINKNPSKNECAIVATYNACVWNGRTLSYKAIKSVASKEYGFKKQTGTPMTNICGLLAHFKIKAKPVPAGKSVLDVLDILSSGRAILIGYNIKGNNKVGHIAMVTPGFKLINPEPFMPTWADLLKHLAHGNLDFSVWTLQGKRKV
jgi:hypothetical protein